MFVPQVTVITEILMQTSSHEYERIKSCPAEGQVVGQFPINKLTVSFWDKTDALVRQIDGCSVMVSGTKQFSANEWNTRFIFDRRMASFCIQLLPC
jgi:hypothetical protein